jgi:hypothetical protein
MTAPDKEREMSERERDVEYERLRNELIDSAVDQENARRDNDDMAYLEATNAAIDAMEALDTYVNTLAAERDRAKESARAFYADWSAEHSRANRAEAERDRLQAEVARLRGQRCPACNHDAAYHCTRCGDTWYAP